MPTSRSVLVKIPAQIIDRHRPPHRYHNTHFFYSGTWLWNKKCAAPNVTKPRNLLQSHNHHNILVETWTAKLSRSQQAGLMMPYQDEDPDICLHDSIALSHHVNLTPCHGGAP
jgi:hypothetical protein